METERITPQSLEGEQSTLGAMMVDTDAIVEAMEHLTPEMFYREIHKNIFTAIVDIFERGTPVDVFAINDELRLRGQLEAIGSSNYLFACIEACPSSANIASYIKPVKRTFIERQVLKAGEAMAKDVHSGEYSTDQLLERSESRVMEVGKHQLTAEPFQLSDLVAAQRERVIFAANNPDAGKGTPSGFYDLDKMTGGFKPSELITIAGMSSMGKSALASQIAFNALQATGRPVIVFSLEMSKEQWLDRMTSAESRIEGWKIRTGNLEPEEWERLDAMQTHFAGLPMHIIDTPAMTTREIKAQCRRLAALYGTPALIVIDYLQIAEPSERIKEERLRVTQIVRDFKNLARQIEAPVVCLSQLSRAANSRENKRPVLSDLRETSAIEAESDAVAFVYRPSYYKPKGENQKWVTEVDDEPDEIILGKQRNGPTGIVQVKFVPEYARFENLARGEF